MAENTPLSGALVSSPTDPAVIHKLLADPEFQSLNSDQKKELLLSADPVFADFNGADIEKFAATKPRQQSIDEAMAKALQKNKGAGNFPEVPEPTLGRRLAQVAFPPLALYDAMTGREPAAEALAQGGLETILAGTPEAIAARSGIPIGDRESAKFRNPYSYAFGESLGALAPLGELGKAATAGKASLSKLIKEGIRLGSIYGAAGGVASEAKKEAPQISDAASKGIIGSAIGATLGAGIPLGLAAGSAITKKISGLVQERISEFNQAMAESVKNVTNKKQTIKDLEDGFINEIEQIVQKEKEQARKVSGLEERESAVQFSSQEELARLQQEAQARGSEARNIILENQPQIAEREAALQEAAAIPPSITEGLPPAPEPSELGGPVIKNIESEYNAARKQTKKDYDSVKEVLPSEQPRLPDENRKSVALKIQQEQQSGSLGSVLGADAIKIINEAAGQGELKMNAEVKGIYDNIPDAQKADFLKQIQSQPKQNKGSTWSDLQSDFQKLNDLLHTAYGNQDGPAIRVYSQLKDAVNKDMQKYADKIGGDVKIRFDKANANYAAREEKFGNTIIQPLLKDKALESPESIVNKIIGEENVSTVNNLKKILTPENFSLIQSTYADRLFSPQKGVAFDPAHFVVQFDNHSDEVLKSVFGEQGFKALNSLYEAHQGAAHIDEMNKAINEVSRIADQAEKAFQGAKTPSDERRIIADSINLEKEELTKIRENLNFLKSSKKNVANRRQIEAAEEALSQAEKELYKKKNPLKSSGLSKLGTTLAIVGTTWHYGHPGIGATIATANLLKGTFAKAFVDPRSVAAFDKAFSRSLTQDQQDAAIREFSRVMIESSTTIPKNSNMNETEKQLADSIQKAIDKQAAESIPK